MKVANNDGGARFGDARDFSEHSVQVRDVAEGEGAQDKTRRGAGERKMEHIAERQASSQAGIPRRLPQHFGTDVYPENTGLTVNEVTHPPASSATEVDDAFDRASI
jgi:hypothetical protein